MVSEHCLYPWLATTDQPLLSVSRAELVGWLQHHIAEQKRVDVQTSGAQNTQDYGTPYGGHHPQDVNVSHTTEVQLILPADIKKQRKHVKHLLADRGMNVVHIIYLPST